LVVDDDPINVEVLRVRLSAQGYEVVTAIDGEDGLQRARELEPDLVLLDVMMPKLDIVFQRPAAEPGLFP
jgi:adenylate cyclase